MKITLYSTHRFEKSYLEAALGDHKISFFEESLNVNTAQLAAGSDAVCIFVNDDGSLLVLEALQKLGVKFIALRSAGYNHVNLAKARELGLRVANVPGYSPYAVAEHTVAMMLALNRKLASAHNRVMELNFSLDGLVGFDMNGKTVGIIGTGKIGEVVAKILHGLGCNILAYDRQQNEKIVSEYQVRYVDLNTLYRNADIITLHVPLVNETRHLIDESSIRLMKPGVMLINTSRGALIKTQDVVDALKARQIGNFGMDVYEEETTLFF